MADKILPDYDETRMALICLNVCRNKLVRMIKAESMRGDDQLSHYGRRLRTLLDHEPDNAVIKNIVNHTVYKDENAGQSERPYALLANYLS